MDTPEPQTHVRFRDLWHRYEKYVRWLCLRAARGNLDLACDLIQEAALRLLQRCEDLRQHNLGRAEKAWVKRVTLSAISNTRRRDSTQALSLDALPVDLADDHDDDNLRELLDDLMAVLSPDDRHLMQLFLNGYSLTDMAILTGLTYNVVSTRLTRIRHQMAQRARQLKMID